VSIAQATAPRKRRSWSRADLIESRIRRAVEEAQGYEVRRAVKSGEGEGVTWWVSNAEKRSLYLVAFGRCSCKDDELNGNIPGFGCKHVRMVELHLGVNDPTPTDEPEPVEVDRYAQARRDRDLLWD